MIELPNDAKEHHIVKDEEDHTEHLARTTYDELESCEMLGSTLEKMDALRRSRYLGRHRLVYQNENGEVVLTLGPHWCMYLVGMIGLITMGIFTIYNYWRFISAFKRTAIVTLMISECFFYTWTALKNPGIKTRMVPDFTKSAITCKKCLTTREDKCVHCPDCDVCIEGHDHHCIWTGKCIGRGNLLPFIFFIACTPAYFVTMFLIFGENPSSN